MKLTLQEFSYLGLCLEGFLFGLYSGIFVVFWQYYATKEGTDSVMKRNIIFYVLCGLYVLSGVLTTLDIVPLVDNVPIHDVIFEYKLDACENIVFAFCDFIAQSILIYRCWIMWGRNLRAVFIPSILAFGFLGMWVAGFDSQVARRPYTTLALTSLTASMTVNTLATALIVFRIFKVFHHVKIVATSDEKPLYTTVERKLRSIIFILIESGMALFAIQLTRVVITALIDNRLAEISIGVLDIIVPIHKMLNGITPTIIQVRVAMGSSFHDEPSLEEAVSGLKSASVADDSDPGIGSIRPDEPRNMPIEHDDPIPILEMGNVTQEGESHGIQMVDR